jgi:hypothetical protein
MYLKVVTNPSWCLRVPGFPRRDGKMMRRALLPQRHRRSPSQEKDVDLVPAKFYLLRQQQQQSKVPLPSAVQSPLPVVS